VWLEFWASAVNVFSIQPSAAWALTPVEFWALVDQKQKAMQLAKTNGIPPMSRAEFDAMRQADRDGNLGRTSGTDHGQHR
jgi:hypothetical protein